jgi:hypothetical protein
LANQERRWLKAAIRDELLPALHGQGFEPVALTGQEKRGELPSAFPFGRLRRARESGFDVVEIQLPRHGKPAFRISAGFVPSTGIDHPVAGHVPAEEVWSSDLPRHYVFYELPPIQRWFSLWHWPGRQVTQADVGDLVAKVATNVIPEIESALREGRLGKHGKVMGWER